MKSLLFFISLFLIKIILAQNENYIIHVECLPELRNNIHLEYVSEKKQLTTVNLDSIESKYFFRGIINKPIFASLFINNKICKAFYIEPTLQILKIKDTIVSFMGSKCNDDYREFDSLLNVNKLKFEKYYNSFERLNFSKNFIASHKNSQYSLINLSFILTDIGYETSDSLFNLLDINIQESNAGKLFRQDLDKMFKTKAGTIIKNFDVKNLYGLKTNIKSQLQKNDYFLIDFWATWCSPCIKDLEELKELKSQFGNNLKIITISIDNDFNKWKKIVSQFQIDKFSVCFIDSNGKKAEQILGITTIPCKILVDKNLKIIDRFNSRISGKERLIEMLNKSLKK